MTQNPASESSTPLYEPGMEVPMKNIGIWVLIPRAHLERHLSGYSFLSHSCQSAGNWFVGASWPQTKPCHFYVFILYAFSFYFSVGLITYVVLLLLTPKMLSLPFDFLKTMTSCPGLIPMLPSTISLIAVSAEHSPPDQLKTSQGEFLHFKEGAFFNSENTFTNNNHMWCLFLIWWHLTTLKWTDVTMDIMWLLILTMF